MARYLAIVLCQCTENDSCHTKGIKNWAKWKAWEKKRNKEKCRKVEGEPSKNAFSLLFTQHFTGKKQYQHIPRMQFEMKRTCVLPLTISHARKWSHIKPLYNVPYTVYVTSSITHCCVVHCAPLIDLMIVFHFGLSPSAFTVTCTKCCIFSILYADGFGEWASCRQMFLWYALHLLANIKHLRHTQKYH